MVNKQAKDTRQNYVPWMPQKYLPVGSVVMVSGNQEMKASASPSPRIVLLPTQKKHVWLEAQSLCFVWVKGLLDADADPTSVCCRLM